ncbi:MAG: hypothetical protein PHP59_11025 [Methanofollis sp.]|uniref:hypothetical protein n=1 Tax=Methanofollis sp. TaxID=2052835 RepID=UPI00262E3E0D|nr:hypothetical protein [Methanofollis sp.]MDD4255892.1 hypothetical protein [Methanofollis sp.]
MKKVAILLLCLCMLSLAAPALAGGDAAVRQVSTAAPAPGAEVTVTLSLNGCEAGGIVEILPPGFAYVSSSLPADQVRVDGNRVCFAILGETAVTYVVRAPPEGGGEITGEWWDFGARTNGTVLSSRLDVGGATAAPGPGALAVLFALAAVPLLRRCRR